MDLTVGKDFFEKDEILKEGVYENADLVDVRKEEPDKLRLDFMIEGELIREICYIKKNNYKLQKFTKGMYGGQIPEDGANFKELQDEIFRVEIVHNVDEHGRTWANIEEIAPAE